MLFTSIKIQSHTLQNKTKTRLLEVEIFSYPPYSPDLVPKDFLLLHLLEYFISDQTFRNEKVENNLQTFIEAET